MTSSHKLSSVDEKQAEQKRIKDLTKSESVSKKNEVNVTAMAESQKIAEKKYQ